MTAQKSIFAVGRRKTSVARIKIIPGSGKITVNDRESGNYFPVHRFHAHAFKALEITSSTEKFDYLIRVSGGGLSSQSGAVRLGIARALQKVNPEFRPDLKKAGLLARDSRMVERKKFGLHKARRGTQFSKR